MTKEPQHNAYAEALGFVPHPNLRTDLNPEALFRYVTQRTLSPIESLKSDPNKLYQDGKPIGTAKGAELDETHHTVKFESVFGSFNIPNPGAITFRGRAISECRARSQTGNPPFTPLVVEHVECRIE